MSSLYKFFSYNYFNIFMHNLRNNDVKEKNNSLFKVVFCKEVFSIVFCVLIFLSTYVGLKDVYIINYQKNILFYIFKDNISNLIIWFLFLSILPILTCIFNKMELKSKYYLLLVLLYLVSNLFNVLMIIYFIFTFSNSVLVGFVGVLNILVNLFINMKIIVLLVDYYLKK